MLRLPGLLVLAAILAIGAGATWDRLHGQDHVQAVDPVSLRPGFGPANFAAARARVEFNLASARQTYAMAPDEWLRGEGLARALIAGWRIGGDYAELAEADRLLDQGLAEVPDPAGPVLSRAMLSVLVHRLDQADSALDRAGRSVAPDPAETADAAAWRGDVALQRGQLDRAGADFSRAFGIDKTTGISLRVAMLTAYRGNRSEAARELDELLARPRQQPAGLAELMLQRANLAYWSGDWDEAGRWIGASQRVFPGYWLADAYAAQQFALAGRTAEAIRAYQIVVKRTRRPALMDALAHLLRLKGQREASRKWAADAGEGWEARAQLFPEAVIHHQAEHELAAGSAARALALAQTDASARPQAPNLVLLARALLSAGRPREALAVLDRAHAQGWVSAGQLMGRAEVLAALGDAEGSAAATARAEELNPRAADPRTKFIWFGHD